METKKFTSLGIATFCVLFTAIIAFASAGLFYTKSVTSNLTPKTFFQFDLLAGMQAAEIGPGDSFDVSPAIYNDATENMYVFIVVDQPASNYESLYTYTVSDGWTLVSTTAERQIYAYAGDEMTCLMPGDTTEPLTAKMTMRSISNAEFSILADINVTITGYAISTDDAPTDPEAAWETCKYLGNLE